MKLGIQINRFDFPGGTAKIGHNLKILSAAAEDSGFDSIWVMDHFFQIQVVGDYQDPMMEAYTTLGYIAGITKKVKLGTMVTGVIYREPAVLINAVTALDVLSGGRAYFGIGAGWNFQEAIALGLPDPRTSRRFDRLEDTLKLALQMWSDDSKPFKGKIYTLPEPLLHPGPLSKPHPPILIGGGGEGKTLRYVAKYADACNLFAYDMAALVHKLEILKKHCRDVGRSYTEIEKTVLAGINISDAAKSPNQLLAVLQPLRKLGIDHAILSITSSAKPADFEALSPVMEQIHNL